MLGNFDGKYFNAEVFMRYMEEVPRVKQNALLESGVLRPREDFKTKFTTEGGNYAEVPLVGLIGGAPANYDGATDIPESGIGTYSQGVIVVGRSQGWAEKDFTAELTRHDFMRDIAKQTVKYWDDVDQQTMLHILKGVMSMNNSDFVSKHTLDISESASTNVAATTLNTLIQRAAGANKSIFTMAIMHSAVATNLENLQVLEYFKQTDANGIQRPTNLASWNGRTVLVDDDVPVDGDNYTTYILGQGAFEYADVGVEVPVEISRDPAKNGGVNKMYQRQRKVFAPYGISFVQPTSGARIISPTDEQLATAARWALVKDAAGSKFIDHRAIPIARIISKG